MTAEEQVDVPVPVEVVNGPGAGDAFGGAVCHGLLMAWALGDDPRFCQRGGSVASRRETPTAMPDEAQVRAVLGPQAGDLRRDTPRDDPPAGAGPIDPAALTARRDPRPSTLARAGLAGPPLRHATRWTAVSLPRRC